VTKQYYSLLRTRYCRTLLVSLYWKCLLVHINCEVLIVGNLL